jgi:hypothetical protein
MRKNDRFRGMFAVTAYLLLTGCAGGSPRQVLLISSDIPPDTTALQLAPRDERELAAARERHNEIVLQLDRDWTGRELLALYGLDQHDGAIAAVARAGGPRGLDGRIRAGTVLRISLNDLNRRPS